MLLSDGLGGIQAIAPDGLPLGIDPDAAFIEESAILQEGACALLYTDGFTEACNALGNAFGQECLMAWMAQNSALNLSAAQLKEQFLNDFRQFDSAFQRYAAENGQFPAAAGPGVIPTGMSGYLPVSFTTSSPMGGNYQWSGPSSYVVLRGSQATDAIMRQVDAGLDDGNLATGDFITVAGIGYGYHAH